MGMEKQVVSLEIKSDLDEKSFKKISKRIEALGENAIKLSFGSFENGDVVRASIQQDGKSLPITIDREIQNYILETGDLLKGVNKYIREFNKLNQAMEIAQQEAGADTRDIQYVPPDVRNSKRIAEKHKLDHLDDGKPAADKISVMETAFNANPKNAHEAVSNLGSIQDLLKNIKKELSSLSRRTTEEATAKLEDDHASGTRDLDNAIGAFDLAIDELLSRLNAGSPEGTRHNAANVELENERDAVVGAWEKIRAELTKSAKGKGTSENVAAAYEANIGTIVGGIKNIERLIARDVEYSQKFIQQERDGTQSVAPAAPKQESGDGQQEGQPKKKRAVRRRTGNTQQRKTETETPPTRNESTTTQGGTSVDVTTNVTVTESDKTEATARATSNTQPDSNAQPSQQPQPKDNRPTDTTGQMPAANVGASTRSASATTPGATPTSKTPDSSEKTKDGSRRRTYNERLKTATDEFTALTRQAYATDKNGDITNLGQMASSAQQHIYSVLEQLRSYVDAPTQAGFVKLQNELNALNAMRNSFVKQASKSKAKNKAQRVSTAERLFDEIANINTAVTIGHNTGEYSFDEIVSGAEHLSEYFDAMATANKLFQSKSKSTGTKTGASRTTQAGGGTQNVPVQSDQSGDRAVSGDTQSDTRSTVTQSKPTLTTEQMRQYVEKLIRSSLVEVYDAVGLGYDTIIGSTGKTLGKNEQRWIKWWYPDLSKEQIAEKYAIMRKAGAETRTSEGVLNSGYITPSLGDKVTFLNDILSGAITNVPNEATLKAAIYQMILNQELNKVYSYFTNDIKRTYEELRKITGVADLVDTSAVDLAGEGASDLELDPEDFDISSIISQVMKSSSISDSQKVAYLITEAIFKDNTASSIMSGHEGSRRNKRIETLSDNLVNNLKAWFPDEQQLMSLFGDESKVIGTDVQSLLGSDSRRVASTQQQTPTTEIGNLGTRASDAAGDVATLGSAAQAAANKLKAMETWVAEYGFYTSQLKNAATVPVTDVRTFTNERLANVIARANEFRYTSDVNSSYGTKVYSKPSQYIEDARSALTRLRDNKLYKSQHANDAAWQYLTSVVNDFMRKGADATSADAQDALSKVANSIRKIGTRWSDGQELLNATRLYDDEDMLRYYAKYRMVKSNIAINGYDKNSIEHRIIDQIDNALTSGTNSHLIKRLKEIIKAYSFDDLPGGLPTAFENIGATSEGLLTLDTSKLSVVESRDNDAGQRFLDALNNKSNKYSKSGDGNQDGGLRQQSASPATPPNNPPSNNDGSDGVDKLGNQSTDTAGDVALLGSAANNAANELNDIDGGKDGDDDKGIDNGPNNPPDDNGGGGGNGPNNPPDDNGGGGGNGPGNPPDDNPPNGPNGPDDSTIKAIDELGDAAGDAAKRVRNGNDDGNDDDDWRDKGGGGGGSDRPLTDWEKVVYRNGTYADIGMDQISETVVSSLQNANLIGVADADQKYLGVDRGTITVTQATVSIKATDIDKKTGERTIGATVGHTGKTESGAVVKWNNDYVINDDGEAVAVQAGMKKSLRGAKTISTVSWTAPKEKTASGLTKEQLTKYNSIVNAVETKLLNYDVESAIKGMDKISDMLNQSQLKTTSLAQEISDNIHNWDEVTTLKKYDEYMTSRKTTMGLIKRQTVENKVESNDDALEFESVNFLKSIEAWKSKNTKLYSSTSAEAARLRQAIDEIAEAVKTADKAKLTQLKKEFASLTTEVQKFNLTGLKWFDSLKIKIRQYASYITTAVGFQDLIQGFWSAFNAVQQVDDAMTELYRVTDLTSDEYEDLYANMTQSAQEYGASLTDVISSTADWTRAGFDTETASRLSEITIMYEKIADVEYDEAVDNLLASYKGFESQLDIKFGDDTVASAEYIIDILNELDNNYSVTAAGIGEALQRSAASMNVANNSIEQTAALITGAVEVTQDPEGAGSTLKIVSMRLRGAKGELEDLGEDVDENVESITKMQTQVLNFTHGAVNIFDDNGNFKSTYDILKEIYYVWDELSDIEQASLLETIAGKHRANTVASILQNFEHVEDAYESALNSEGSATTEFEKYTDSITASIQRLTASWQVFSNELLNRDVITTVTALLNNLLGVLTKITSVLSGLAENWFSSGGLTGTGGLIGAIGGTALSMFGNVGIVKTKRNKFNQSVGVAGPGILSWLMSPAEIGDYTSNIVISEADQNRINEMLGRIKDSKANGKVSDRKIRRDAVLTKLGEMEDSSLGAYLSSRTIDELYNTGDSGRLINSYLGYRAALPYNNTKQSLQNTRGIIRTYNKLNSDSSTRTSFANQISLSNAKLGDYLNGVAKSGNNATASMGKYAASLTRVALTSAGLKVFTAGLNGGLDMIAGVALSALLSLLDEIINKYEHLNEKIKDVTNSYGEQVDAAKQQASIISSVVGDDDTDSLTRFEKLSKGVAYGNKNISLTVDEYQEYLSLVDAIAEAFPELIRGYDASGHAILNLGKDMSSLRTEYKKTVEAAYDTYLTDENVENISDTVDNKLRTLAKNNAETFMEEHPDKKVVSQEGHWGTKTFDETVSTRDILTDFSDFEGSEEESNLSTYVDVVAEHVFYIKYDKEDDEVLYDVAQQMFGNLTGQELINMLYQADIDGDTVKYTSRYGDDYAGFEDAVEGVLGIIDGAAETQMQFRKGDATYGEYVSSYQDAIDAIANSEYKDTPLAEAAINAINIYDAASMEQLRKKMQKQSHLLTKEVNEILNNLTYDEFVTTVDLLEDEDFVGFSTVEDVREYISQMTALSQLLEYEFDVEGVTANINTLSESLEGAASATGLTVEAMNELGDVFDSLENYDEAKLFEETANGLRLNTTLARQYREEYVANEFEEVNTKIAQLLKSYDYLNERILATDDSAKNAKLIATQEDILKQVAELAEYGTALQGLTSAYNDWQTAKSAGNNRDMYESVNTGISEVEKELEQGWVSDGTKEFFSLIWGDNWNDATKGVKDYQAQIKSLDETIAGTAYTLRDLWVTDDSGNVTSQGVFNFLHAVNQATSGKYVETDEYGNVTSFNFGVDYSVIAEALGISEELVDIFVQAAKDATFTVNFEGTYQQLADMQTVAATALETLKELGKISNETLFTFNTMTEEDLENLETQLEDAGYIKTDEQGNRSYDFVGEGGAEARIALSTAYATRDAQRFKYDDMTTSGEYQEYLELAQEYQELEAQRQQLLLDKDNNSLRIKEIEDRQYQITEDILQAPTNIRLNLDITPNTTNEQLAEMLKGNEIVFPATIDFQSNISDQIDNLVKLALINTDYVSDEVKKQMVDEIGSQYGFGETYAANVAKDKLQQGEDVVVVGQYLKENGFDNASIHSFFSKNGVGLFDELNYFTEVGGSLHNGVQALKSVSGDMTEFWQTFRRNGFTDKQTADFLKTAGYDASQIIEMMGQAGFGRTSIQNALNLNGIIGVNHYFPWIEVNDIEELKYLPKEIEALDGTTAEVEVEVTTTVDDEEVDAIDPTNGANGALSGVAWEKPLFVGDYTGDVAALEAIASAAKTARSETGMTVDEATELSEALSEYENIDPTKLFVSNADLPGGFTLNEEYLAEKQSEIYEQALADANNNVAQQQTYLDNLIAGGADADTIRKAANDLVTLTAQRDNLVALSGAYQQWIDAQAAGEKYDAFESIAKYADTVETELGGGYLGDASKEWIDLMSAQDLATASAEEYLGVYGNLKYNKLDGTNYTAFDFIKTDSSGNITAEGVENYQSALMQKYGDEITASGLSITEWAKANIERIVADWMISREFATQLNEASDALDPSGLNLMMTAVDEFTTNLTTLSSMLKEAVSGTGVTASTLESIQSMIDESGLDYDAMDFVYMTPNGYAVDEDTYAAFEQKYYDSAIAKSEAAMKAASAEIYEYQQRLAEATDPGEIATLEGYIANAKVLREKEMRQYGEYVANVSSYSNLQRAKEVDSADTLYSGLVTDISTVQAQLNEGEYTRTARALIKAIFGVDVDNYEDAETQMLAFNSKIGGKYTYADLWQVGDSGHMSATAYDAWAEYIRQRQGDNSWVDAFGNINIPQGDIYEFAKAMGLDESSAQMIADEFSYIIANGINEGLINNLDFTTMESELSLVTTAIKEVRSETGLTTATIQELVETYGDLDGFDLSKLIINDPDSANGLGIDEDYLKNITEQQRQNRLAEIDAELEGMYASRDSLVRQVDAGTLGASERLQEANNQITMLERERDAYEALGGAYQQWINAQSAGEKYDVFEGIASYASSIESELANGYLGEATKAWIDLVSAQDLATASAKEYMGVYYGLKYNKLDGTNYTAMDLMETDDSGNVTYESMKNYQDALMSKYGDEISASNMSIAEWAKENIARIISDWDISEEAASQLNAALEALDPYGFATMQTAVDEFTNDLTTVSNILKEAVSGTGITADTLIELRGMLEESGLEDVYPIETLVTSTPIGTAYTDAFYEFMPAYFEYKKTESSDAMARAQAQRDEAVNALEEGDIDESVRAGYEAIVKAADDVIAQELYRYQEYEAKSGKYYTLQMVKEADSADTLYSGLVTDITNAQSELAAGRYSKTTESLISMLFGTVVSSAKEAEEQLAVLKDRINPDYEYTYGDLYSVDDTGYMSTKAYKAWEVKLAGTEWVDEFGNITVPQESISDFAEYNGITEELAQIVANGFAQKIAGGFAEGITTNLDFTTMESELNIVTTVMSELRSETGLTVSTMESLLSTFGDIEGFDWNKLFIYDPTNPNASVNGFVLNEDYLNDLVESKKQQRLDEINTELEEAYAARDTAETWLAKGVAGAEEQLQTANNTVNMLEAEKAAYEALGGAFQQWVNAKSEANDYDLFKSVAEYASTVQNEIATNTLSEASKAWIDLASAQDLANASLGEYTAVYYGLKNNKLGDTGFTAFDIMVVDENGGITADSMRNFRDALNQQFGDQIAASGLNEFQWAAQNMEQLIAKWPSVSEEWLNILVLATNSVDPDSLAAMSTAAAEVTDNLNLFATILKEAVSGTGVTVDTLTKLADMIDDIGGVNFDDIIKTTVNGVVIDFDKLGEFYTIYYEKVMADSEKAMEEAQAKVDELTKEIEATDDDVRRADLEAEREEARNTYNEEWAKRSYYEGQTSPYAIWQNVKAAVDSDNRYSDVASEITATDTDFDNGRYDASAQEFLKFIFGIAAEEIEDASDAQRLWDTLDVEVGNSGNNLRSLFQTDDTGHMATESANAMLQMMLDKQGDNDWVQTDAEGNITGINVDVSDAAAIAKAFGLSESAALVLVDEINDKVFNPIVQAFVDGLDVSGLLDDVSNLSNLLAESISDAGVTQESIDTIDDLFKNRSWYDQGALYESTENGVRLNKDVYNQYVSSYVAEETAKLTAQNEALGATYDQLTEEINQEADAEKREQLIAEQANLKKRIEQNNLYIATIKGATSAYKQWTTAESAGNNRDMYSNIQSNLETIKDELEQGWVTDSTEAFFELMFGDAWSGEGKSIIDWKNKFEELSETIDGTTYSLKDFYKTDADGNLTSEGLINWLNAVIQLQDKLGKKWVEVDAIGNIVGYNFDDDFVAATSSAFGMSESLTSVYALGAQDLPEYIITLPRFTVDVSEAETTISGLSTALNNSLSNTGVGIDDFDSINEAFEDLEGYNPDKLFEDTALGLKMNAEAAKEYKDQYLSEQLAKASEEIETMRTKYDELTIQIQQATTAEEKFALIEQRDYMAERIDSAIAYTSALKGMTSAYTEWIEAQSVASNIDSVTDIASAIETATEEVAQGIVTEETKALTRLLYGDAFDTATASLKDWQRLYRNMDKKEAGSKRSRASWLRTDDEGGTVTAESIYGFLDSIYEKQGDNNYVQKDETGKIVGFDFSAGYDVIAQLIDASPEFVQLMVEALRDLLFDVEYTGGYAQVAKSTERAADALKDAVDTINKEGVLTTTTLASLQAAGLSNATIFDWLFGATSLGEDGKSLRAFGAYLGMSDDEMADQLTATGKFEDQEASVFLGVDTTELDDASEEVEDLDGSKAKVKVDVSGAKGTVIDGQVILEYDSDAAIQDYENVVAAIKEASGGDSTSYGLSWENMENVNEAFKELDGYDPSKMFTKTGNGIKLNNKYLAECTARLTKVKKATAAADMDKLVEEYNRLTEEINNCTDAKERESLLSERDSKKNDILKLQQEISLYDARTDAYNRWVDAQAAGNEYDDYESIADYRETVEDEINRGFMSDASKAYIDMLSGYDLAGVEDGIVATIDEYYAAWQELYATVGNTQFSIMDFFTLDDDGNITATGVRNFMQGIREDFEGEVYKFNEESGEWIYDFSHENLEKISREWNVGIEAITRLLMAANPAGFNIRWTDITSGLDLDNTSYEELTQYTGAAADSIHSIYGEGIDLDFNYDAKTAEEAAAEVDKAMYSSLYGFMTDSDGNFTGHINWDMEGATEASLILRTLLMQKWELEKPSSFNIDTSKLDTNEADAVTKANLVQEAANDLQVALTTGTQEQIDAANTTLQTAIDDLGNVDKETLTQLGIDIENITNASDYLKENPPTAGVTLEGTAVEALQKQLSENLTVELVAERLNLDATDITKSDAGDYQLSVDLMLGQTTGFDEFKEEITKPVTVDVNANIAQDSISEARENLEEGLSGIHVSVVVDTTQPGASESSDNSGDDSGGEGEQSVVVELVADDTDIQNTLAEERSSTVVLYPNTAYVESRMAQGFSSTLRLNTIVNDGNPLTISANIIPLSGVTTGGLSSSANGTAFSTGTAYKHGDWGTADDGTALVGELGQELVVRDGNFFTIGDNGAEFFQYKKDDIIFNAGQTKQLLEQGRITSGTPRGRAFASGYNQYGAIAGNSGFAFREYGSSSSSYDSDYDSDSDSDSEDTEETLDWIEILIKRIETAIDHLDKTASSTYKKWTTRNTALADQLALVGKEIDIQWQAYERYLQEANSVGLSEEYAAKVRDGLIDIETITDGDLKEAISDYQTWFEKATACLDTITDLKETEAELYEQRFENVETKFSGVLGTIEHEKNLLEEFIDRAETKGWMISTEYYKALGEREKKNVAELEKQRDEQLNALNDAMKSGKIEMYTEAWYEMCASIDETTESLEEANTQLEDYKKSIRELEWEQFDHLQDRISRITSETEFLVDVMSSDELYEDNGQLTNSGRATMGLHGVNYNVEMAQADKAAKEAAKVKKELEDDEYNQDLLDRYDELIDSQQEHIKTARTEKEAIRDMVEQGINKELESLKDLIEKREELLEAEQDLYDYRNNVIEQAEEIAKLEKQLSAYSGDNSEETMQTVQQIKVDLEESKQQLEETEYDQYVSDQKQMLDDLYDEYEETINKRLDDLDLLISDMTDAINANSSTIEQTLIEKADGVGYTLSEAMKDIWDATDLASNTNALKDVITTYSENFESALTTTNNVLSNISWDVANMIDQLNKLAETDVKSSATVLAERAAAEEEAKKQQETQPKPDTSPSPSMGDGVPGVGDKVTFTGGSYYYDSQGTSPCGNQHTGEEVYITNVNNSPWASKPYHISTGPTLGDGDLGWLTLDQLSGYATGARKLLDNEMAWTQENGREFIIRPSDGAVLTPLMKGDSVLTAMASANLWNLANNPADFIKDALNISDIGTPVAQSKQTTVAQNIENVTFLMPNVKNYDEMLNTMKNDRNFERLIDSMTIDRLAGGSSLAKGKAIR